MPPHGSQLCQHWTQLEGGGEAPPRDHPSNRSSLIPEPWAMHGCSGRLGRRNASPAVLALHDCVCSLSP